MITIIFTRFCTEEPDLLYLTSALMSRNLGYLPEPFNYRELSVLPNAEKDNPRNPGNAQKTFIPLI